jgi:hypothetical protein
VYEAVCCFDFGVTRPTDRTRFQRDAEDRFPIKIDIRVPPAGEPWQYTQMLRWCRENVATGEWQQHGYMDKTRRDEHGIPIDYTRWYFMNEADAAAFKQRWAIA